jgi:uncharacterized membrane protein YkvA (DUF1232 family)
MDFDAVASRMNAGLPGHSAPQGRARAALCSAHAHVVSPVITEISMKVVAPRTFPLGLVYVREYTASRFFSLVVFLFACAYFVVGLRDYLYWENSWMVVDSVMRPAFLTWHVLAFTLLYCIAFALFDLGRTISGAASVAMFMIGLLYIVSPIDFFPDPVPVLGALDDAVIGGGLVTLGTLNAVIRHQRRQRVQSMVRLLGNDSDALARELLLIEGYRISQSPPSGDAIQRS